MRKERVLKGGPSKRARQCYKYEAIAKVNKSIGDNIYHSDLMNLVI